MYLDIIPSTSSWILGNKLLSLAAATVGYLLVRHHNFIWAILRTLRRDLTGSFRVGKALVQLISTKTRNKTVGDVFNETVAKYPDKICFYFQDEKWTFSEVHELTNKIGNYFSSQGFQKGDVIGIFMENCPEYIPMWLGLSKIGVVPALVNTNLRLEPLKHSFDVVKCKAIIYAEELSEAIKDLKSAGYLAVGSMYSYARTGVVALSEAINLEKALADVSVKEPTPSERVNFTDNLYFIYTSGTTGLPKAATIKHARFFMGVLGVHHFHNLKTEDILYTSLPLYHSAGGMLGSGQVIIYGTTMALRKKFSASNFWSDCVAYNVSVIQYIGEICRYLLAQPPSADDKEHSVRIMLGNGMRREIWEKFTQRFNIPEVAEFYASTEGNANITNIDSTVGAVGFVPRLMYPFVHFKIIKVNEQTGEIIRNPQTGLAIICKPNEPGEFVGTIIKNHIYKDFQGYVGSGTTNEQKIARDIFKTGDMVFRSGDLMVMDELGYFYFKDRCGDTFRWKGENVSTTEVESVIASITKLKDCVVYGVQINGTEGRAGMAAIVDDNANLDLENLAGELERKLPAYARPLFLRITEQIDATGTYKFKKMDLQREGFNIGKISDPIYFLKNGKYVPLESQLYQNIISGEIRL